MPSRLITPGDIKEYVKQTYGVSQGIDSFLAKHKTLKPITFDTSSRSVPRVLYHDVLHNPGTATAWDVALSFHRDSYLTGHTAFSLLGWTKRTGNRIYVNWIRRVQHKVTPDPIDDEAIQRVAFVQKADPPVSLTFRESEIVVLSGQIFSRDERMQLVGLPSHISLPKYALIFRQERMFIEALINYHVFGGPDVVWQVLLSKAREVDQDTLARTYAEMKLKYPYANAIGYILDSANPGSRTTDRWLKARNGDLRFHLFMGDAEDRVYVEKWSLFVPRRFFVAS